MLQYKHLTLAYTRGHYVKVTQHDVWLERKPADPTRLISPALNRGNLSSFLTIDIWH
jgi:hypothetical protein